MQQHEDRTVVTRRPGSSSGSGRAIGNKRDRLAKLLSVPVTPPAEPRALPDEETSEPKGMLRELAEVSLLLAKHQLVSLVGDAGAGKSVLARSLTRAQKSRFPGGAYHCDVSPVGTLRELLETIAEALGLGPLPLGTAEAITCVETALAKRESTLLVLDGFDDLSLLAADTLERWISASPLTVLVTAREPLAVFGEQVFYVQRTRAVPAARRGAA
jgi:predicted ATPase